MTQEENLDEVVSRLSELGFKNPGMREWLEGMAGVNPVRYIQRERIGDDRMTYSVDMQRGADELLNIKGYNATLLQTHPITHGLHGGIDTHELEQRMQKVDWQQFEIADQKQRSSIIDDIMNLAAYPQNAAKDIAKRLMLRYWIDTPVEQLINIFRDMEQYEKSMYFPVNNNLDDIHAREAYNLLAGRSVLKFYQQEHKPGIFLSNWKQLNQNVLITHPEYALMPVLKSLPIVELQNETQGTRLIYDLIRGERVSIHLNMNGTTEKAFIEADPKHQSVKLYSPVLSELNVAAYQLNDVQQQLFWKDKLPKATTLKQKNTKKRKGKSL